MGRLYFLLLFFPLILFGNCPCPDGKVAVNGIVIIDAGGDIKKAPRRKGITIKAKGKHFQGIEKILAPYLCTPVSNEQVQNIKNKVLDFLKDECVFAMVIVPEQEITDGILIFEILSTKIGTISFEGQKWFSKSIIENGISLKEGDCLDQDTLLNELAFLNRNASRKTDVFLSPGEKPGTTNLEFLTKDSFPCHFYIGANNEGVQIANRVRLFVGANWNNAFMIGDTMSFQYIAAPNFHEFQAYAFAYSSDLRPNKVLTIFGSYGQIYADIPNFRNEGKSGQISMRYKYLMRPLYRRFKQEFEYGLDYKYLNSNLFFIGIAQALAVTIKNINVTQLEGAYSLTYFWGDHQVSLKGEAYISPVKGFLPHQTNQDYDALRPGSSVQYAYFKVSSSYRYSFWGDCSLFLYLRGQAATGALPASEQFSLGGIDTVRGYEQTQYLVDDAICANIEFYLPSFHLSRQRKDKAAFLFFYDVAYGLNYDPTYPGMRDQFLSGAGPAFRYEIPTYLTLQADYGFVTHKIPGGSAMGLFYLSGTLSY